MDSLVLCQMLLCRGGIDMARRIKERKLKSPNITIIGEGLTERCYFKHLKSLKGYRYTCKPRNFSQQSIDDLQKQIDKVLEDEENGCYMFEDKTYYNHDELLSVIQVKQQAMYDEIYEAYIEGYKLSQQLKQLINKQ